MGASNARFRKGFADDLPLEDAFADVLISNGVLNLTPDKNKTRNNAGLIPLHNCHQLIIGPNKGLLLMADIVPGGHTGTATA